MNTCYGGRLLLLERIYKDRQKEREKLPIENYRGYQIVDSYQGYLLVLERGGDYVQTPTPFDSVDQAKDWIDNNTSAIKELLGEMHFLLNQTDGRPYLSKKHGIENPDAEWALWSLLKEYEDSLPPLNYYFHKAFRQIDVTSSGKVDVAIWKLLSSSILFWKLFDKYEEKEDGK